MQTDKLTINTENLENLQTFSQLLKKDTNTMINEALEEYFERKQEELLANDPTGEGAMTNLSFDEFWDDLDI